MLKVAVEEEGEDKMEVATLLDVFAAKRLVTKNLNVFSQRSICGVQKTQHQSLLKI